MENFFYEDYFCSDIDDLISNLQFDEEEINDLPDDWGIKVELTELQPIFQIDMDYMVRAAMWASDKFEDRFGDNWDERHDKSIEDAFKEGIDIDKINAAMPKFFYPSGKKETIIKQDLLDNL